MLFFQCEFGISTARLSTDKSVEWEVECVTWIRKVKMGGLDGRREDVSLGRNRCQNWDVDK